jgi:hypothetical protein
MVARHIAFGLHLRAGFEIAGMPPGADPASSAEGLPVLDLQLAILAQLEQAWSGPQGPPAWRGRLGDGRSLTIQRGARGDVLFTYGDQARFLLDRARRRLDCAPRGERPDWQRALIGKIVPCVSVMRGYEALHAAAVDTPDGVIAIAGASGSGKSTLALELMRRGWSLFTDDELTLQRGDEGVRAHAGTPHMSLAQDDTGPDLRSAGPCAGKRWLVAHNTSARTRPLRMVCLLERRDGLALQARNLPANPLLLAPHMLGLSTSPRRQRSRFCLYADLVEGTALVNLTGGRTNTPTELAQTLDRSLREQPARPIVGVA